MLPGCPGPGPVQARCGRHDVNLCRLEPAQIHIVPTAWRQLGPVGFVSLMGMRRLVFVRFEGPVGQVGHSVRLREGGREG